MIGRTPPSKQRRQASFLLIDGRRTTSELALVLGCPAAEVTLHRTRGSAPIAEVVWEVTSEGDGDIDLTQLIERTVEVAKAKHERLTRLSTDPSVTMVLRIVHYVGESEMGPGFAIHRGLLAWLAELGASVDVDQYWCP